MATPKNLEGLLASARSVSTPQYYELIPVPEFDLATELAKATAARNALEDNTPINPLEPQTFSEFVGQAQAKEVLKIIVDAANMEERLIPNVLLTGAFGHGKTTLAKLIAKRHHKKVSIIDGVSAASLVSPSPDRIYVIDEAHNIPAQVADSFNILIDASQLRIVACTTNPGALPSPFRSRFRTVYLQDYSVEDIELILQKASKLNPRTALSLLEFVRESTIVSKRRGPIDIDAVVKSLEKLEIDDQGLTSIDRRYLDLLSSVRPTGLQYLSSALSLDKDTIQEEIEPYLIRQNLIERTPKGRIRVNSDVFDIPIVKYPKPMGF
jgi:Holliday junction DNA helicase RuvB